MKLRLDTLVSVVALAALVFGSGCPQKNVDQPQANNGSAPYQPSRLEWLVAELNAEHRWPYSFKTGWSVVYVARQPDTVVMKIIHYSDTPTNRYQWLKAGEYYPEIAAAEYCIEQKAKEKGWNWVKVEKDLGLAPQAVGDRQAR